MEKENINLQKIVGSGNRKKLREELKTLKKLEQEKNNLIGDINKKYPKNISDDIYRIENKIKLAFSNQEFLLIDRNGNLVISKVDFDSRGQTYHEGFILYNKERLKKKSLICPKSWIHYFTIHKNKIVFGFISNEYKFYVASQDLTTKEIKIYKK